MRRNDHITSDFPDGLQPWPQQTAVKNGKVVVSEAGFETARELSMRDPAGYWAQRADELVTWSERWEKVATSDRAVPAVQWFPGGKLNISSNCLDRHIANGRKNKAALIWQGEPEDDVRVFTYQMLLTEVCRLANVMKKHGVVKGDRVVLYLPMVPELAIAMLACTRIGAVHCVVFAGFSARSLQGRIQDCKPRLLITADSLIRAGRTLPLKSNVNLALKQCNSVTSCLVVKRAGSVVEMEGGRDYWYHKEMRSDGVSSTCEPVPVDATDPLFILYTSGSTGEPKGVVHGTGGYFVYVLHTCQLVFGLTDQDVHWCTADLGWITGHSYLLYGPLGLGSTSLMFEGTPAFPGPNRCWQIVEKFCVNIFYTAPTLIRALMRYGQEPVEIHDISSLRLLGSVGEPINPEAWMWYFNVIGQGRIPIVDTWWETETGGIMIAPSPSEGKSKPGAAMKPLPGVDAIIVDEDGNEVKTHESGRLVIQQPWPGMLTGLYGDEKRYRKSYFSKFPGGFDTGDGACCDNDGDFWIIGRLDDVISVSGHRLGTAEIEASLVSHPAVSEAAVVGMPHAVKGQAIYAYITLKEEIGNTPELFKDLQNHVRSQIGPIAVPDIFQYSSQLPKTRSGKIMRRVLRKIASGDYHDFGDISTLADPSVIDTLIRDKKNSPLEGSN